MTGTNLKTLGLSAIALCALTNGALAQDAGAGDEIELGGIVVYGAKNAQTLDDTTASVGIVTSEEIDELAIDSFRQAFRTLGNVADADFVDGGFIIRGINSEGLTPGGAPLASFYIDGIQQTVNGTRRGARGLWDVEQVEVYRGPQSTLTGRAALAGAIYVKTKDPTYRLEGKARATFGSLDTAGGALMVNVPLIADELAIRVSTEYSRQESDINYPTFQAFDRFDDLIEDEYFQIRGKLLFEPKGAPDTRALLTYSFSSDSPQIHDIGGPVLGFEFSDDRGDFNVPVFAEVRRTENNNAGLEVTHDIMSALRFTSLTTYSHSDTERPSVNEGTAGETNVLDGDQIQELATQEFRLNYDSDPLKGVIGVYFAYEDTTSDFVRPEFFGFARDVSDNSSTNYNVAGFGEVTYEFLPSWKVVAGGRLDYTDSEVSTSFSRTILATNVTTVTGFDAEFDEFVPLPKVGLIKEFGEDHTIGFTIQRGFRNGGAGVQRSTGQTFTFDPEFTWTYEGSYKGRFLDDRLRLSANVFYTEWQDQQVEVLEDPLDFTSAIVTNAASSESIGFEIESNFQFDSNWSAFVSVGYVDTEFKEFNDVNLGDLSGLPFPEAPEWNVAFGAQYVSDLGFFAGFDAKYIDEALARFGQPPQEFLDGYFVANAQFGYKGENFAAMIFAENLFDERYFTFTDNDIAATLGPRQFIGVRVTVNN